MNRRPSKQWRALNNGQRAIGKVSTSMDSEVFARWWKVSSSWPHNALHFLFLLYFITNSPFTFFLIFLLFPTSFPEVMLRFLPARFFFSFSVSLFPQSLNCRRSSICLFDCHCVTAIYYYNFSFSLFSDSLCFTFLFVSLFFCPFTSLFVFLFCCGGFFPPLNCHKPLSAHFL